MKLVLVTPHYPPHFEGGTEVVVRAHARELARRGHELQVVSGTDRPHRGADVERADVDGIPVVHLPRRPDECYDLELERPRLAALIREQATGADLVHVHHWSTLHRELVRDLRSRGLAVVLSLHDLFATCPRFFRHSPVAGVVCPPRGEHRACVRCIRPESGDVPPEVVAERLRRRSAAFEAEVRAASAVTVPSRSHGEHLAPLLGLEPGRMRILPHGLCHELGPRAPGDPAGPPAPPPLVVLHFGNRSALKGTLDLVRALASLPAGAVELVLAGAEVEQGFDRRLREAAGPLSLTFHGPYGAADLPRLAAGAHLAAFPSRVAESYGLVVDEALAAGLPVWVSDRGALPERVAPLGAAGRVLPAEDPAAWAAAFGELIERPEALAGARAALPASVSAAADAAARLEALYVQLLGERP